MHESQLLNDLKNLAVDRASRQGHQLGVFRSSRSDPERYVSFCQQCRHLVIIDLFPGPGVDRRRLYGYALEAGCPAHAA